MKRMKIQGTELETSNIVMGCMRLGSLSAAEAEKLIGTAMDEGINFFDHADIYGAGECERLFSNAARDIPREKMILQSKCGIRKGYYDFSRDYILQSVDGILERLNPDYLDVLLLHRPDALMEPEEVAEAIEKLNAAGKVRYFGLSNHNPMQTELLQKYTGQKLVFNQLQFSVVHTPILDSGMAVNMGIGQSVDRAGSILEYCRLKGITVQAWSPFQRGFFEGVFLGDEEHYPDLNRMIAELAEKYRVTPCGLDYPPSRKYPGGFGHYKAAAAAGRLCGFRASFDPFGVVRAVSGGGKYDSLKRQKKR